ncbi:MAG: hypothetical protein ACJ75B_14745 [Flavisolibacter sp.]
MRAFLPVVLSIVVFASCKNSYTPTESNTSYKMDTDHHMHHSFTLFSKDTQLNICDGFIMVPKGWRLENKDDDSPRVADATARYRFHNADNKIIYLEYGLGAGINPAEPDVLSSRFRKGYIANKIDTSDIIFSDNPGLARRRWKSKYFFSLENISNFQADFFRPKHIGKGYTGFYIDSIGQVAGNIASLAFYAEDLNGAESKELENVARSLLIKDFR